MTRSRAHILSLSLSLFVLCGTTAHAQTAPGPTAAPHQATPQPQGAVPGNDVAALQARVSAQQQRIDQLQGMIDIIAKKPESNQTALYAGLAVVIAAVVGGVFAFRNQNHQAAQGRLLKAVEIIMESRSGYQADIRSKNLAVFLDDTTRAHLENIREIFSGPEYTDLHVQLATAMSAQAKTPGEVLEIWRAVLKEKNIYTKVTYTPAGQASSPQPNPRSI